MSVGTGQLEPPRARSCALAAWGWPTAVAVAVGLAVVMRGVIPTNEDVSWLIDVAERTLAGAHPYVDWFEVNPPASVALYIPAVALGRLLGLASETATDALVFASFAASAALAGNILRRAGLLPTGAAAPLLFAAVVILLVVPTYTFAEREHVATLAVLPVLATVAARCVGATPSPADRVLAGLGLAATVAIKPMFALGIAGPALLLLYRRGPSQAFRCAEFWIGTVGAALYGAAVLLFVPAFTKRVLPVAVTVYVPQKTPALLLLTSTAAWLWLSMILVLALWGCRRRFGAPPLVLASASAGFAAVFVIQGKGFAYHAYPAMGLALLAVATCAAVDRARRSIPGVIPPDAMPTLSTILLALSSLMAAQIFDRHFDPDRQVPGLSLAIKRLGPHPRVIAISPYLAFGHPFVRRLGGTWIGSAPSTWVSDDARQLIEAGAPVAPLQPFVEAEKARYADDIARNRPDAVIVGEARWQGWIDGSTALTRAMASYHLAGRYGDVSLWTRDLSLQAARP